MKLRIVTVVGAVSLMALPLSSCGGGSGGNSSLVATGSVTCGGLSGSVSFDPPLTLSGTAPERSVASLTATDCTTSGSNVARVDGVGVTATITGTSGCLSFQQSRSIRAVLKWDPPTIRSSLLVFSGFAPSQNSDGDVGFVFPDSAGAAKAAGSFAVARRTRAVRATAYSSEGTSQLLVACSAAAGLSSIVVTSGSLTVG